MSMSLIYGDKKLILSSSGGKITNNIFYLFNQYLGENEISTNFNLGNGKNVIKNKFLKLNILEKNSDGTVLNQAGKFLLRSLVKYIEKNKELFSSSSNLNYLGLFDECLDLVGADGCGDLDSIIDTKASDTYHGIIDSAPVSPVTEMLTDESVVSDSVAAVDPLPVYQTEDEDDVVPDQGEIDASAYPLSHEEIGLAIGRDILVWDGDRLVVTDEGRENDIFMILYGNKIEAVNMQAVSDTLGKDLSGMDNSPTEAYFKILEKYDIVKRTDGFDGYKIIMSGDIDVPLTDTRNICS